MEHKINNDLILREKLAIQRTILANQTTLLAFMRTSMYFLAAGLSIDNLLEIEYNFIITNSFYFVSIILFIVGLINYFIHFKRIKNNKKHIGEYKAEYDKNNNLI